MNWEIDSLSLRGYTYGIKTKLESQYFIKESIPVSEAALVLVDVWQSSSNSAHMTRSQKLFPNVKKVLNSARKHSMFVVHAPRGPEEKIAVGFRPINGEVLLDSDNIWADELELHSILQRRGIKTLFYAGFATNMCVINRPYGIKNMSERGYNIVLLRDCTDGIEFTDTENGMWVTKLAIRDVEINYGHTTTSDELINSFKNIKINKYKKDEIKWKIF